MQRAQVFGEIAEDVGMNLADGAVGVDLDAGLRSLAGASEAAAGASESHTSCDYPNPGEARAARSRS